ncbi:hypothetical protein VP01_466g4 [Puccinia sorghi]|uniref:SigF-like NTF2-like domain-containing protein n=1 Tax=Puccinia sorghi TaxID=27349 RepID=A0A0L6UN67_9BASI|nr:hypothetical protein VP01_466g4 [Puccinia sorghi]
MVDQSVREKRMENPQEELACVVLSLTERHTTAEVFQSIDRYFTQDATLNYPFFNQIYSRNGRENLKAAWQWRQTFTFMDRTEFNAVMVSKDQTEATLGESRDVSRRQYHSNHRVPTLAGESVQCSCELHCASGLAKMRGWEVPHLSVSCCPAASIPSPILYPLKPACPCKILTSYNYLLIRRLHAQSSQQDNLPTDLTQSGLPLPQFVRIINDVIKAALWLYVVFIGHILILLGIF